MMKNAFGKILKILICIMLVFVGIPIGFAVGRMLFDRDIGGRSLLELVFALFIAYFVNIVVHEGGHLVFGLICGYRFCSFRIGSLMIVRQMGKMNLRSFKLAGTGGQCLMIPPEKQESKAQIILYNLGGIIFNILFALICITIGLLIPKTPILTDTLMLSGFLSVFAAITNGIPMNAGGIANDGMNALHLSKNPDAAEAFRKTLLINAAQTEGERISDMPDEWFALPNGADMQNVHCASLKVFAVSRPLDRGDTLAAEQQISDLLNSKYNIIGLHKNLLTCDLICCKLLNGSPMDKKDYLTPELVKVMKAMKSYPQIIRTWYFIALLDDKNELYAQKTRMYFEQATKKFPYRQDVDYELALMDKALEKFKNETYNEAE